MTQAIPFAPAVRFAALINLQWRAVGWCSSNASLPGAVIRLITRRFYRFRIRFASFAAGKLRPRARRKPSTRTTKPQPPPRDPMPRHSGWLVEMVPAAAAGRGHLTLDRPPPASLRVPRFVTGHMQATDVHVRFPSVSLLSQAEFTARRRADQDRLDARHLHEIATPLRAGALVQAGTCAVCLRRAAFTSDSGSWDRQQDGRRVPRWDGALTCDCADALPKQARAIVHFAEREAMLRPWTRLLLFGPPDPSHRRLAALAGSTVTVPALRAEGAGFGLGAAPAAFQLAVAVDCLHRTPPLDAAFAAFRRALAPGGSLLFTVPFRHDAARTVSRTDLGVQNGRPPALLREPAHEIGWDVLDRLRAAGFAHAAAHWYWSAELGYLGAFSMIFHAAL